MPFLIRTFSESNGTALSGEAQILFSTPIQRKGKNPIAHVLPRNTFEMMCAAQSWFLEMLSTNSTDNSVENSTSLDSVYFSKEGLGNFVMILPAGTE